MKNTLYVLLLAALSLSSLKADYIKKAIDKGKTDIIKGYSRSGATFTQEDIDEYTELAEAQLEQKKKSLDASNVGGFSSLELLGICAELGMAATALIKLHSAWNKLDEKKDGIVTKAGWDGWGPFGFAGFTTLYYAVATAKKFAATNKQADAVDKAEKVLRAIQTLEAI